jgi:hypothetical protein
MGFEGRAVYLDVDMLVLGDVAELLTLPTSVGYTSVNHRRTDVSVIDCAWFKDKAWWPKIADVQTKPWRVFEYCQVLNAHGAISPTLPRDWNVLDTHDPVTPTSKLLHFTSVPWQPWHPYPTVKYLPHPRPEFVARWREAELEVAAGSGA